ncbi:MAG: hypothetical protein AAGI72_12035 [Pseudomonadota bacterium]
MDTILSVIGVLGLGALVIAVSVFVSAARRKEPSVDNDGSFTVQDSEFNPYRQWVERAPGDRRQNPQPVLFPITLNGVLIPADRRVRADRRRVAR